MGDAVTGQPRSRHDRGLTALIEGFFGFVWFGWGQANASAGLGVWLSLAGVAAAVAALVGGVLAFRSPASTGVRHDRQARRRYGIAVGVEFTLAGVGAGTLLSGFAVAALVGRRAHAAPQLRSPHRPV